MATRIWWFFLQIGRRLWFRAALFAVLGVASALLSIALAPFVPGDLSARIGADAVDKVLGVIASSMLTVAIFSLSTMVAAYGSAASSATPRATQLLQQDTGALNALGTFIGAFLFSLVGIIALSTGAYGTSGRLLLFMVTLAVVAVVVVTFIGWIDRLSRLGRVGETIDRVGEEAAKAFSARLAAPSLGAEAARPVPVGACPVACGQVGYVQHIDVARLAALVEKNAGAIDVAVLPGAFVAQSSVIAFANGLDEDAVAALRSAFVIGARRSYEQDPRFGVIVLSEIASRALSPAVNDPGTAIDVMAALVRTLSVRPDPDTPEKPIHRRVFIPEIEMDAVLEDCIAPIARDGAALVEVGLRLQRTLRLISEMPAFSLASRRQARGALARGLAALSHDEDRARLSAEGAWLDR